MSDIKRKKSKNYKKSVSLKKKKTSSQNASRVKQNGKVIESLIRDFNLLFLDDDAKPTEKKLKDFSREDLINVSSNGESDINYKNFIIFLLKISGLEIDIDDSDEIAKFSNLQDDTCTDEEVVEQLVENCGIRAQKIKNTKIIHSINSITEQIYNCFDIIRERDYEAFKNFIIAMLKLSANPYRKLRHMSCIILCKAYELLYDEMNSTSKIITQKKKSQTQSETASIDKSSITLLSNKKSILEDMISLLKEKFIEKKIGDISQNIRLCICDTISRVCKKNFEIVFNDSKMVKFYPYFLNDPSPPIKVRYLQLLYDKLDTVTEEDSKTLKILIKILSVARDAILSICVKEEKMLAKQGIKIIELLSQHKILEIKTVHQLLPHLFNPEYQIRYLVSKVVKNYILNFENEEDDEGDKEKEEDDMDVDESEGSIKKEKKIRQATTKNANDLIEFIHKLTDNEPKMVRIIVDNFFDMLSIFKNFKLFFAYIDELISSSQSEMYLIHTTFLVITYSIDIIQKRIEEEKSENLLSNNEEFINLFVSKVNNYIKKFRLPVFENFINSTQCEILNALLELFQYFKIYQNNVITFGFDMINEIVVELKNSFFINIVTFAQNEKQNSQISKNENSSDPIISNEQILFEKLCENLLKSINSILTNETLFSSFNFNQTKFLDELIFSDKNESSSLSTKFYDILYKEVLNSKLYKEITSFSLKDITDKISSFTESTKDKFYIVFTQMNYMIIYFKKIFIELGSKIDYYKFVSFLLKIISINLSKIPTKYQINSNFKFNSLVLSLIETLHLFIFNIQCESSSESDKYTEVRNDIINTIFSIVAIQYEKEDKVYNDYLLQLKTKAVGIFLDTLTYISSDKLSKNHLKFDITPELEDYLIDFIRDNFISFFVEYNRWFKKELINKNSENENEDNNSEDNNENANFINNTQKNNFCYKKKDSQFTNELLIKTCCFKIICEKYSRLILLNFGIFKYIELSCLYFESFFLIKHQNVIENMITHVFEILLDKEVNHYMKKFNDEENQNANNADQQNLSIMIFYLTKITMKIFNNKSKLYSNDSITIEYEDKVAMISRYLNYYSKCYKKMKQKYNTDNINIIDKDKNFYENFILNGISFALESKIPNTDNPEIIDIENVYFLEFIKMFLKTNIFLNENDIKNLILAYLKLSKKIEITDKINMNHIKFMEKFKTYLLNKGKVILSRENENEEEDNNEDEEDKDKKSKKKKNKGMLEEESDEDEEEDNNKDIEKEEKKEDDDDNEDDENELSTKKNKKSASRKRNKKSSSTAKKSRTNKKRKYNEANKNASESKDENKTERKKKSKKT